MSAQVTRLSAWLRSAGISWDEGLIQIRPVGGGLGVFARADVLEGAALCAIPRAAVLSMRTTGVADLLEMHGIRGGLGLIIAIMHELSSGRRSPWHGYLSELPAREYLPLFWGGAERALLQGTERAGGAGEDERLTAEDFEEAVLPLVARHPGRLPPAAFTLERFRRAASWVASRAFGVDSFHGMSLVPLADIFNHKAAVVSLSGDYQIQPICFGDEGDEGAASSAADSDTEGPPQPGGDVGTAGREGCAGHGGQCGSECGQERADAVPSRASSLPQASRPISRGSLLDGRVAAEHRLEIGICAVERQDGEEILQIVAASGVEAGRQVHNTYGELGSAELVAKYGFALPPDATNPFDAVTLDKGSLLRGAGRLMSARALRARCRFLAEESELLREDEEPFEVLPGACIGPSLLVTLHVLLADEADFQIWQGLEEALEHLRRSCCTAGGLPDQAAKQAPISGVCAAGGIVLGYGVKRKRALWEDQRRREACPAEPCCGSGGSAAQEERSQNTARRRVLGAPAAERARTDSCTAAAAEHRLGSGAQEQPDEATRGDAWRPGATGVAEAPLEPRARGVLGACIRERLARYRLPGVAQDRRMLAQEERRAKTGRSGEGARARLAALRLVVAEKELLLKALSALGDS